MYVCVFERVVVGSRLTVDSIGEWRSAPKAYAQFNSNSVERVLLSSLPV